MDAFVKSASGPRRKAGPFGKASSAPIQQTLALCRPSPGILEHEAAAVQVFETYPLDQWYDLGQWLHRRQLLFGPRPGQHRAAHSDVIPEPLLEMFKHARAALLAEAPDFGEVPETPSGCAINRYAPTLNGKGNGLGPHRDKGQWKPLVIGVTLVESRKMALADDYKEKAKRRYELPRPGRCTPSRTNCTRWWHESMKRALAAGDHLLGHLPLRAPGSWACCNRCAKAVNGNGGMGCRFKPIMDEIESFASKCTTIRRTKTGLRSVPRRLRMSNTCRGTFRRRRGIT